MTNLLLSIDAGTIDWSRAQFALTAIYHWLFVPLTLGLAVIMGIAETIYYKKRTDFWKHTAQFWQRLFGVNFAMGVATGIILEFEFGTNWSNYSWFVGDIFGAPLAVEGIVAFFMESTFVAVMFFGWKKVSAGFHLASTWLTGLGATISAWWILVANAWMQYPVGCAFNPDTMRNEMTSFLEVALSPFAVEKFCHTVISSWIIGAVFVVAVSCWYLVRKRHTQLAVQSIRIAAIVGFVAALGAGATGHKSGQTVAQVQPMKLAAMEALYDGGHEIGLKVIEGIEVPYGLSMMATNTLDGYVPGINDLLDGYVKDDGTVEPSVDEKIERGKLAIQALADYRKAKAEGADEEILNSQLSIINSNMPYFGYGYVKDKADVVPPVWINFWAFRAMVGLGCLSPWCRSWCADCSLPSDCSMSVRPTVPLLPMRCPHGSAGQPYSWCPWLISPPRVAGWWLSSVVSPGPSRICCLRGLLSATLVPAVWHSRSSSSSSSSPRCWLWR